MGLPDKEAARGRAFTTSAAVRRGERTFPTHGRTNAVKPTAAVFERPDVPEPAIPGEGVITTAGRSAVLGHIGEMAGFSTGCVCSPRTRAFIPGPSPFIDQDDMVIAAARTWEWGLSRTRFDHPEFDDYPSTLFFPAPAARWVGRSDKRLAVAIVTTACFRSRTEDETLFPIVNAVHEALCSCALGNSDSAGFRGDDVDQKEANMNPCLTLSHALMRRIGVLLWRRAMWVAAQDFPISRCELSSPWAPGGGLDVFTRIMAPEWRKRSARTCSWKTGWGEQAARNEYVAKQVPGRRYHSSRGQASRVDQNLHQGAQVRSERICLSFP